MDDNRGCALSGTLVVFGQRFLRPFFPDVRRPVRRIGTIIGGIPILPTGHAKKPAQHVFDQQYRHR
jgi:hypothetical protein